MVTTTEMNEIFEVVSNKKEKQRIISLGGTQSEETQGGSGA